MHKYWEELGDCFSHKQSLTGENKNRLIHCQLEKGNDKQYEDGLLEKV